MRQLFAPLYWLFFVLLVAAGALVLWAIASDSGSRWLIERLTASKPGLVEVHEFSGSLARGFSIDRLHVQTNRQDIVVNGLRLDYRLAPLREKRLRIQRLAIDNLRWRLPPPDPNRPPPDAIELPVLDWPLGLLIDELTIGRLVLERIDNPPIEIHDIRLKAGFRHDRLLLSRLQFETRGFRARIGGSIDFTDPPNAVLGLLLSDDDGNRADLALTGRLQDYRLQGTLDTVARGKLPPTRMAFRGNGNTHALAIDSLTLDTLDGTIAANGRLDWSDDLTLEAAFSGSGIDPAGIDPRFAGELGFGGQARYARGQLSGQIAAVGTVQGYPLRLETVGHFARGRLAIRQGRLLMGENHIDFRGRLDRDGADDFRLSLQMPQPEKLYPPLSGQIHGNATLDGPWSRPSGKLSLRAEGLHWRTVAVARLDLGIDNNGEAEADYRLAAKDVKLGNERLAALELDGRAGLETQRGRLRIDAPSRALTLGLRFAGTLDRAHHQWQGEIDQATLAFDRLPRYRQQKPATVTIANGSGRLTPLCLNAKSSTLCIEGRFGDGNGRLDARLDDFPLRWLSPWHPLAGYLKKNLAARLALTQSAQRIDAEASVEIDRDNRADASVAIDLEQRGLSGQARARFDRFDWLDPLSDKFMEPEGALKLDATIGGTLDAPAVTGRAVLQNGSLRLPGAGIRVEDIALTVTSADGRRASLQGQLKSGGGSITLNGDLLPTADHRWRADVRLSGEDFLAAQLPLARVWASPQLQIAATPGRIDVAGVVTIPKADIRIKRLPETAIAPSDDVYFVDAPPVEKSRRFDLYSRVLFELGDDVHLSGFGVDADLAGRLLIDEQPGRAIAADGSLKVVDGHYEALGQKLDIERGEIYWNGPLDAPALNLRAVRKAEGVTTGLEIRGPILHPESKIFSDPPMDETNALAYLLTGKPFGAGSAADSDMLLTAVARLGLKGSARLVDDLRRRAGLDVLAIQPGQDLEQSTLVIGKYLSARFYLEYTTSLFEDASILSIRYRLNRYLQLKAESGDQRQSIDLIYEIER